MIDKKTWLLEDLLLSDVQMRELVLRLTDEQREPPCLCGLNPPVWEMGHCAFFYEVFILRPLYGMSAIMPGLDEMWDSFEIPHKERWSTGMVPDLLKTLGYYESVINLCRERLESDRELSAKEEYLFQYAIAHQNMHLESLMMLRQTCGCAEPNFVGVWGEGKSSSEAKVLGDAVISGGRYLIGQEKPLDEVTKAEHFCFDNEKPAFEMELGEYAISQTLVSNGEFLEFVEDGGYQNPDYWSFGGLHWLRETSAKAPEYWSQSDGQWGVRRFDQWELLRLDAAVLHVSYREAAAYCEWAGRRLPSEFEWEVAAGRQPVMDGCDLQGRYGGTAPVSGLTNTGGEHGCLQMMGTAWEWTEDQYLPYAGFELDMYVYMSTLQFGDHNTTKGGSWATSKSLIRPTYRQAYLPSRRDVFTGFRTCAKP